MTIHFNYHHRWFMQLFSGDNQSVRSSVPVVSRWLWPGNRTFLEVTSMVVTRWTLAFLRSAHKRFQIYAASYQHTVRQAFMPYFTLYHEQIQILFRCLFVLSVIISIDLSAFYLIQLRIIKSILAIASLCGRVRTSLRKWQWQWQCQTVYSSDLFVYI